MKQNRLVSFNGGHREASPELQLLIMRLVEEAKTPQLYNMLNVWMNLTRLEDVVRWLIVNKLTGWQLHNWFVYECKNSPLDAARFVLGKLNRNPDQKVMYGQDWLP